MLKQIFSSAVLLSFLLIILTANLIGIKKLRYAHVRIPRTRNSTFLNSDLKSIKRSSEMKEIIPGRKNSTFYNTDKNNIQRGSEMKAIFPPTKNSTFFKNDLGNIQKSSDIKAQDRVCEKYFPKAIVIGVRKCGTSALEMFLKAHPDIDNVPVGTGRQKSLSFFYKHYEKGLAWYLSQMPCSGPDKVIVEHSSQYYSKEQCINRISMFNSRIKLILLVREPISRTISQYLQSREQFLESSVGRRGEQFGTSFDVESFLLDESRVKIDIDNFAVSHSSYDIHMQKWLKLFPLNQFHIIDAGELAKQPLKPLKQLENFLGVRSYFDSDTVYFNETRGFHCVKDYSKEEPFRCPRPSKGREHPQLTDSTYNLLKEYFDPLNDKFFKNIGKEFNWTTIKRIPLPLLD